MTDARPAIAASDVDAVRAVFSGRTAILFDLDGTLYGGPDAEAWFAEVDRVLGTRVAHHFAASDGMAAFRALGQRMEREPAIRSKSEALTRWFGISLGEMNRFRERQTAPEEFLRPDPAVAALLARLAGRFRLVLGTNNSARLARRTLRCLGIDEACFAALVSSEDAGVAKPEAGFFRHVVGVTGFPPGAIVSVGDRADSDLVPAAALGFGTWQVRDRSDVLGLGVLVAGDGP